MRGLIVIIFYHLGHPIRIKYPRTPGDTFFFHIIYNRFSVRSIINQMFLAFKIITKFCCNNRIFFSSKTKMFFPVRFPRRMTFTRVWVGHIGNTLSCNRVKFQIAKIVGPVKTSNQRNYRVIMCINNINNVFYNNLPFIPGTMSLMCHYTR